MAYEKKELLYEGKAKRIYKTNSEDYVWIEYKDSATAFNGEKKSTIDGKGVLNNKITSLLFEDLKKHNIDSHYVEQLSDREQIVKKVTIIPIEVVVRNIAAGSLSKRLGLEEGTQLSKTIIEFYYKNDDLGDPMINDDHIEMLQLAKKSQLEEIRIQALKVNDYLVELFYSMGVDVIDFKIEFGIDSEGKVLLADEISPDTCRLWDVKTKEKLDKDVFRRDIGNLTDAYSEILKRLGGTLHV